MDRNDVPPDTRQPLLGGLQLTAMDPTFRDCPHLPLDRLRTAAPVHADIALGRWFLTRFDDIKAVVSDRTLSVDPRKAPPGSYSRRLLIGDAPVEEVALSMLHLDDPDHKRIRGLVTQAFNQRAVDAAEPRMHAIAERLLDAIGEREAFEVIADYAAPLPTMVIAEMLGVEHADLALFKRWSDAQAQIFNPARTPEQTAALTEAHQGLEDCITRMIALRRRQPGRDIVSGLVAAQAEGDRLTDREIVITCNLLLVAGNLTTTDLIGNAMLALLRHPAAMSKLRAQPALIAGQAIEEALRYDPPVAQSTRIATSPLSIGGVAITPGQAITVSLLAASHDPAVHNDPHCFDISRQDTTHLAFGGGVHYCLGAQLARAEARVAITHLLGRFATVRLDPAHEVRRKRLAVFNGVEALWVRTD
ncbi:MAG TPA: cytochrome P450 [Acetobacteraceae bacterium]|nr:cytochrome P450 [Acetobacteraceae bacterium]